MAHPVVDTPRLRLDLPETDWDEVGGVIEDAYSFIAG